MCTHRGLGCRENAQKFQRAVGVPHVDACDAQGRSSGPDGPPSRAARHLSPAERAPLGNQRAHRAQGGPRSTQLASAQCSHASRSRQRESSRGWGARRQHGRGPAFTPRGAPLRHGPGQSCGRVQAAAGAYVPVQRGDIFVARDVMSSFPYAVPQDELRGAPVAVLVKVPDSRRRVSGSVGGERAASSFRFRPAQRLPHWAA